MYQQQVPPVFQPAMIPQNENLFNLSVARYFNDFYLTRPTCHPRDPIYRVFEAVLDVLEIVYTKITEINQLIGGYYE